MFDSKFWQEIKRNNPKAYRKFVLHGNIDNDNNFRKYESGIMNLCYCDIEKFFDEQGIIITITKLLNKESWNYYIDLENPVNEFIGRLLFNSSEAKLEAVRKSFEILNEILEKE